MYGCASSEAKTCSNRNEKHQTLSDERKIIFNTSSGTDKIPPNNIMNLYDNKFREETGKN
jgi:hypothetical protein